MTTAVVIATHKGTDLLKESLPLLTERQVYVVQTGTHDPAVERLCNQYENVSCLNTLYSGYDTGAYLWAYWLTNADNFLFMQDSCFPREADFVEQFAAKMPGEYGAVGWSSFTMECWDSDAQRTATEWMYGPRRAWPRYGIFGPIFYTNRKTLDNMAVHRLLPMPPVHKEQQQAMERAWAILFHRAGMHVNFLVNEEMPRGYVMEEGGYPALKKVFRLRA